MPGAMGLGLVLCAGLPSSTPVSTWRTSDQCGPAEIVDRMRTAIDWPSWCGSRYVDRVARGLSVVVNTLDPDILVLGGGMANVDELYDDLPRETRGGNVLTVLLHPHRSSSAW